MNKSSPSVIIKQLMLFFDMSPEDLADESLIDLTKIEAILSGLVMSPEDEDAIIRSLQGWAENETMEIEDDTKVPLDEVSHTPDDYGNHQFVDYFGDSE